MNQKPSMGRIVHYVMTHQRGSGQPFEECPAIITRVWSDTCVNLHLLRDHDQSHHDQQQGDKPTSVMFDEAGAPRSWHWPERV